MSNKIIDIPHFILSLTDKCNLNCSYCFEKNRNKNSVDLSLEDWKAIYDKYEPRKVQLFGGEPTLRWNDILEFLDYVVPKMNENPEKDKETYQCITITTNGTTGIDFETIPKEYRNRVFIGFSLDGFEEINDKNRGKGSYKKTHDAIIRCLNAGIFTGLLISRFSEDYLSDDRLEEFIRYFVEDIGVKDISFGYIMQPNSSKMSNLAYNESIVNSNNLLHHIVQPYLNKCSFTITNRKFCCTQNSIHIHTNGYINPRCPAIKPIVGHWTQWSKEDLIKWLNYCVCKQYDCKSTNWNDIEKFAQLLLNKER